MACRTTHDSLKYSPWHAESRSVLRFDIRWQTAEISGFLCRHFIYFRDLVVSAVILIHLVCTARYRKMCRGTICSPGPADVVTVVRFPVGPNRTVGPSELQSPVLPFFGGNMCGPIPWLQRPTSKMFWHSHLPHDPLNPTRFTDLKSKHAQLSNRPKRIETPVSPNSKSLTCDLDGA